MLEMVVNALKTLNSALKCAGIRHKALPFGPGAFGALTLIRLIYQKKGFCLIQIVLNYGKN
jgi:hypothetical protein